MEVTIRKQERRKKGNITDTLRSLSVSDETCAVFKGAKQSSVYSIMVRLKNDLGYKFVNEVYGDEILVWRVA